MPQRGPRSPRAGRAARPLAGCAASARSAPRPAPPAAAAPLGRVGGRGAARRLYQRLALCRDRPPAAGTHGDKRRCTGAQARADQLRAPLEHRRRPSPDAADSPRDRARGGGAAPRSDPGGDSQTRIAARDRATRTGVGAPPRSTMDPGGGRAAAPAPRAQPGPPRRAARTLRRRRLQTLVRDRAARPRPALPPPSGQRTSRPGRRAPRRKTPPERHRIASTAHPSRHVLGSRRAGRARRRIYGSTVC